MLTGIFIGLPLGLLAGAGLIFLYLKLSTNSFLKSAGRQAALELRQSEKEARNAAREIELEAKQTAMQLREKADDELQKARDQREAVASEITREKRDLEARTLRLDRRDDALDRKAEAVDQQQRVVADRETRLEKLERELQDQQRELRETLDESKNQLKSISGMTEEQARETYLRQVETELKADAGELIRKTLDQAEDEAKQKARQIILQAVQRYAAEQTADHTVSTITITDDAMKGRVIGREGRNIRSFERATGVDVIIDDTPGVVSLSCFDPVRREIARTALERLLADGRIHPGRIEESVEQATTEMQDQLIELGKTAAQNAHVQNLARPIVPLLGRLNFRTSYGQNVLQHSSEVAHLAQIMADELGLDGTLARRAGLLHDIGKALDHETEGGHPEIGAALLKKHGEPDAVVNAAAAHHGDVPATTPYTPLIMAADAISASRPGARRESLERYIKRLEELEDLAREFDGVRQAYAIHAGREIRVIADARALGDQEAAVLARDIAKRIENTLSYPGEIRITVLREVRSVEFAK